MKFEERFKPIQDRIIVKRIKREHVTESGIILNAPPKHIKEPEGVVLRVGRGRYDDKGNLRKMTVKKGDKVLVSKNAGSNIKFDGEEYLIIREEFVHAILED